MKAKVADAPTLARWRLILGPAAEDEGIQGPEDEAFQKLESLLDHLFDSGALEPSSSNGGKPGQDDKAGAPAASGASSGQLARGSSQAGQAGQADSDDGAASEGAMSQERTGGKGAPVWTLPRWVEAVRELFPVEAKEVMERELVRRRGIDALLKEPRLLERVEPSVELVKVLLSHKSLLNEHTRPLARQLIDRVVSELKEKIRQEVEVVLVGALRRDRRSSRKILRNLNLKRTVWRNLQNYDSEREQLRVEQLYFFAAERKRRPWHIIVAVDQSGSMLESAIYSAIMASIFAELPSVHTSLFIFDTEIVDLSAKVGQPVDVLLSVQLGGGTNIGKALTYAEQLLREPQRTLLVLITDFHEGGDTEILVKKTESLADAGVRLLGLGALSYESRPSFCRHTAGRLRRVGMDILACTPEQLGDCVAQIIGG